MHVIQLSSWAVLAACVLAVPVSQRNELTRASGRVLGSKLPAVADGRALGAKLSAVASGRSQALADSSLARTSQPLTNRRPALLAQTPPPIGTTDGNNANVRDALPPRPEISSPGSSGGTADGTDSRSAYSPPPSVPRSAAIGDDLPRNSNGAATSPGLQTPKYDGSIAGRQREADEFFAGTGFKETPLSGCYGNTCIVLTCGRDLEAGLTPGQCMESRCREERGASDDQFCTN